MSRPRKESLGLAAEYAVASELCRRDMYAQLTLGHHKSVDLLVESAHRILRIQVKAKQGSVWPRVHGISRNTDFLILVDYSAKSHDDTPDFYILDLKHWKRVIAQEKKRKPAMSVDSDYRISYPDGWKGINIKPAQVMSARGAWGRITALTAKTGKG